MSTLRLLMLIVAAAIVVYVVLDSPSEWPTGPEYPDVDYVSEAELHELLTTPGRVQSIEHALPTVEGERLGQRVEFPVTAGWDADAILSTVAQIEAL